MKKGTLHLIPNWLVEYATETLPTYIVDVIQHVHIFYVEEIRSARRLLKKLIPDIQIDNLTFYMLNEHENDSLKLAASIWQRGNDIAFISEIGCPGVADPGQELVALAHSLGVPVKPYSGPNSIILALMASGMNGQHFQFWGYLPNKQPALSEKINLLEKESLQKNCTQIFIEAPYRNDQLLQQLCKICNSETRLCIAANISSPHEIIISQSIREWRKNELSFHKIPAVFVLQA